MRLDPSIPLFFSLHPISNQHLNSQFHTATTKKQEFPHTKHSQIKTKKRKNKFHFLPLNLVLVRMKLRYAMVCSSNQNRSMEAHFLLKRHGFDVSSYGTGAHVKLPGPSLREPNVYDFGTPYKHMLDDLRRKDPELYKRNGILPMLKRNSTVKLAPQRWQENAADGSFDVVFTFEEKVFDMVVEDLHNREHVLMKTVLIVNLEVKDNHEEAAVGARLTLDLCQEIEAAAESWEESIDDIVGGFEKQHRRKLLYSISFY